MKPKLFFTFYSVIIMFLLCILACTQETNVNAEKEPLDKSMMREYYVKKINDPSLSTFQKLAYMDSLLDISPEMSKNILERKAEIYINSGRFQDAITSLNKLLHMKEINTLDRINIYYNLAYCRQATGEYAKALDNIAAILTTPVHDSVEQQKIDCHFLLARIYRIAGQYNKSDSIFKDVDMQIRGFHISEKRRSDLSARFHLERSAAYLEQKKYQESLAELKLASQYKMNKETSLLVEMGMAELYYSMGKPEIAEDYYQSYLSKAGPSINRIYALYNYAQLLEGTGKHEEASDSIRKVIEYTENDGINHVRGAAYEVFSKTLYSMGKYKEAYEAHSKFYDIMDSVLWQTGPSLTDDFEKELALSKGGMKKRNFSLKEHKEEFIAGIILIIALTIVAIIVQRYMASKRAGNASSPNKSNSETLTEYDESEEPNPVPEGAGLVTLSLKLIEANEIIDEIAAIGSDISIDNETRRKGISNILKYRSANKDFWELFTLSFEKVHPTFFKSLYTRHPELSPGEIRMCAFIITNISSKEIASLTNRSVRTVDSMKYRLHKKLGLDTGTSTDAYLRSLL